MRERNGVHEDVVGQEGSQVLAGPPRARRERVAGVFLRLVPVRPLLLVVATYIAIQAA